MIDPSMVAPAVIFIPIAMVYIVFMVRGAYNIARGRRFFE